MVLFGGIRHKQSAASLSKAKATRHRNSRRGDGSHCEAEAGKRKNPRKLKFAADLLNFPCGCSDA